MQSPYLDKSIALGLMAALLFTALASGAVEPWSVAIFEFILIALLLLWGIKATLEQRLDMIIPPVAFPMAALLILGLVQGAAFTRGSGERASLSMDVEATRYAVILLFFLTFAFIAATNFLVTRERLLLMANVLTIFGAVLAAVALVQNAASSDRIFFLRYTSRTVFGPFVNHNTFAGYMDMAAPIPLGLILTVVRGQTRLLYGFAAALMGTAAIVSGSRSGAISMIASLIFIAILSPRARRHFEASRWSRIGLITVVVLAMLAGVLWIGPTQVLERFGDTVDTIVTSDVADVGRASIWRETWKMIGDHPIIGIGLGSYGTVYPAYSQTPSLLGLTYSHNDYLQIIADAGIIGGIIALWFIVLTLSAIYRGVRSRDPLSAGLSLAAGAGIIAVFIQSLSDTDLQIPSNALLFLVLVAVVSRVGIPEIVLIEDEEESAALAVQL